MSIRMMKMKCKQCGKIYTFYPEGLKLFCPKCGAKGGPDDVVESEGLVTRIIEGIEETKEKRKKP